MYTSAADLHVCAELRTRSGDLHRHTPGTAAYLGQAGVAACFPGILQWEQQHVVSSQSTKYNARQLQMK